MANPAPPRMSLTSRIVVGLVVLLLAWLVLRLLLGFLFTVVRALLFLALFAIVAWVVLVGPPDRRD
ncbi:MAG TPA: hypothetical protein VFZ68_09090 [Acidimicrobiales bacterium]